MPELPRLQLATKIVSFSCSFLKYVKKHCLLLVPAAEDAGQSNCEALLCLMGGNLY